MTKEQYQKAYEINERLKLLQYARKEITEAEGGCHLTYAYNNVHLYDSFYPGIRSCIESLLDKHDKMIRSEIDAEIAALEQEIEVL